MAIPPDLLFKFYPALTGYPAEKCAQLVCQEIAEGASLFAENQVCAGFPLLFGGQIKIIKAAPNGKEILLYRVHPGESCMMSSSAILGRVAHKARGQAETPLRLAMLPKEDFTKLISVSAAFRDLVFGQFATCLGELMQTIEEVSNGRVEQRLAKRLITHPERVLFATHQQLADEISCGRDAVANHLKSFADQNFIELGADQLRIINRIRLTQISAS